MKKRHWFHLVLSGSIALAGWSGLSGSALAKTTGQEIADRADNYIGYDITNFASADFISYVFQKEGIRLPADLQALSREGKLIKDTDDLQPGDVLFFGTSPDRLLASGIYLGKGEFVVAYKPYGEIKKLRLDSSTPRNYYLGAKRVVASGTAQVQDKQEKSASSVSETRKKIIRAGMKYLGTPYEYGSDRSNTSTFDCSDFVRQAYLEGAGIKLPSNSRAQAEYVKKTGNYTTDWRKLKPGDIMFFMEYRGWKASDYKGVNPQKQPVAHNGIYLGNGKILHTYSQESGGVRIDSIEGKHWEKRFIFGGSPLNR
ncbi:hypothetical protein BSNK01_05510 [Bacillaceae bacterium]